MPRFETGGEPAEYATGCGGGTRGEDDPNVAKRAPSEVEEDGAKSGTAVAALISLSGFASRCGVGEDSGSGPATADRRSNGSSEDSEAEGDSGEALRGEWAAVEEANRSFMSWSNRERKEEGAAAVSAGDEACQLDIDIASTGRL